MSRNMIERDEKHMAHIADFRIVLSVRDLQASTTFYTDVLGFRRDWIEDGGWSFLSRDSLKIMLGECPEDAPASNIGSHSYFVHALVDDVDQLHDEVLSRGADVISPLSDTPWGLREFVICTPDGHRIVFGQSIPESAADGE